MARRIFTIQRSRLEQLDADLEARLAAEAPTLCTLGQHSTIRPQRSVPSPRRQTPYERHNRQQRSHPVRQPPHPVRRPSPSASSSSSSSGSSSDSSEFSASEALGQCLGRMDRRLQYLPFRQRRAVIDLAEGRLRPLAEAGLWDQVDALSRQIAPRTEDEDTEAEDSDSDSNGESSVGDGEFLRPHPQDGGEEDHYLRQAIQNSLNDVRGGTSSARSDVSRCGSAGRVNTLARLNTLAMQGAVSEEEATAILLERSATMEGWVGGSCARSNHSTPIRSAPPSDSPTCPICLDCIEGGQGLVRCPLCIQGFHTDCRRQWRAPSCPQCRGYWNGRQFL
jgi:hypothetical protein